MMKKTNNSETLPSNADVTQFLMLRELAKGLYDEMKDLSKKSPNETLNQFKIKSLNRVRIRGRFSRIRGRFSDPLYLRSKMRWMTPYGTPVSLES